MSEVGGNGTSSGTGGSFELTAIVVIEARTLVDGAVVDCTRVVMAPFFWTESTGCGFSEEELEHEEMTSNTPNETAILWCKILFSVIVQRPYLIWLYSIALCMMRSSGSLGISRSPYATPRSDVRIATAAKRKLA
jgi:hypothetical protein